MDQLFWRQTFERSLESLKPEIKRRRDAIHALDYSRTEMVSNLVYIAAAVGLALIGPGAYTLLSFMK